MFYMEEYYQILVFHGFLLFGYATGMERLQKFYPQLC